MLVCMLDFACQAVDRKDDVTAEISNVATPPIVAGVDPEDVKRAERRERWLRRLPLLPALIFTIIVTQVPFVIALWFSLNDWAFLTPDPIEFVGLDNFRAIPGNGRFVDAILNTFYITFGTVFFSTIIATGLAVALDKKFIGQSVVRTLLITPFLTMPVAASLIWRNSILDPRFGFVNFLLDSIGVEEPFESAASPLMTVVIFSIWQWTPFIMLILLAGLQSQSPSVLEAARVDGASNRAIFFQITLPHLRPYLELGALLSSIFLIQTFDAVDQLVSGSVGAQNVPFFVHQRAIGSAFQFGEASAFGVVVVIASIILATVALRVLSGLLEGEDVV